MRWLPGLGVGHASIVLENRTSRSSSFAEALSKVSTVKASVRDAQKSTVSSGRITPTTAGSESGKLLERTGQPISATRTKVLASVESSEEALELGLDDRENELLASDSDSDSGSFEEVEIKDDREFLEMYYMYYENG
jgi:hypothetical protein